MNEQMEFPETWEEYEQEYGFNDSDEVYTNNSRLIQSFRVKQWLDHLEQEPCEDEYIKVPKKALKYRTAGMVAYNAEWLKNHFDLERVAICGEQEPSDNAVSRQAALRQAINAHKMAQENGFDFKDICEEYLNVLPPVNPQQKHEDVAKAFQLGVAFGFGEKHDEMDKVIKEVKKTIEQEPKTGHWIKTPHGFKCSKCLIVHSHTSIFCPSCGAKMVE